MAVIDRFKDALEVNKITDANDLEVPMSAQRPSPAQRITHD